MSAEEDTLYQGKTQGSTLRRRKSQGKRGKSQDRSTPPRQTQSLHFDELTDVQSACLEAAQRAARNHTRDTLICAADVVTHVTRLLDLGETATIARPISRTQASRALQQLCAWRILQREPQGQGGYPSYYTLNEKTGRA